MALKRSELVRAGKEMNTVMGLTDPGIDVTESVDALQASIITAIKDCVKDGDSFSPATQAVIDELRPASEEPETEEEEKTKEEEDANEVSGQSLVGIVTTTKKLAELKALVNEHDELKPLRKKLDGYAGINGLHLLKPEMLKLLGGEEATTATAPKKTQKKAPETVSKKAAPKEEKVVKNKYTRYAAIASVMLGGEENIKEIISQSDILYCAKTGNTINAVKAKRNFQTVKQVFLAFNRVKKEGGKLILV